jgi:hypothetical protein
LTVAESPNVNESSNQNRIANVVQRIEYSVFRLGLLSRHR